MKLEVRCCCDAGKLLGQVEVPDPLVYAGSKVKFATKHYGPVTLEIGALYNYGSLFDKAIPGKEPSEKLAVKSMDTPLHVLESIPTFQPLRDL